MRTVFGQFGLASRLIFKARPLVTGFGYGAETIKRHLRSIGVLVGVKVTVDVVVCVGVKVGVCVQVNVAVDVWVQV